MEIYIEYAFLENFLLDGVLLFLSLKATKSKIVWKRVVLSATLGGVFALIFPLLTLADGWRFVLKFSMGFLLSLLVVDRVKTKKEWGRYALTAFFFFAFSFGFGGVLLGVSQRVSYADGFSTSRVPTWATLLAFALLTCITLWAVEKLYQRKRLYGFIYECRLTFRGNIVYANGFLDTGNRAEKDGLPVCFLSPELAYELFGELSLYGVAESHTEIRTLGGKKRVSLYRGELQVYGAGVENSEKTVYFAVSSNMLSREYKVLLNGRAV